jgi:hypothetical protein
MTEQAAGAPRRIASTAGIVSGTGNAGGNDHGMRRYSKILCLGPDDYDPEVDGENEYPLSCGISPESTVESLMTELQWEIDRSDIPDEVTTDLLRDALAIEARKACDVAAFMTEDQTSLAWFRIAHA